MQAKKILVTGGEGFVGYHLCKALMKKYSSVTCLDINLSGRFDRRSEGVEYIRGDTNNIGTIFKDKTFDVIFHLGEYARLENSFENIDQVVHSNIKGTAEVLEFWRKQKCRLIYAGSSTKFSKDIPALEMSPYSFTKSYNSELVRMYAKWFGLDFAITYFYNVYGEKENDQGKFASLIGIFARKMREKQKLQVVLPGTQKRNFTHVDDIVDGVLLVAEKGEGDNYGIGSDDLYSVNEIAEIFGGEVEYIPARAGNRESSELMTAKIKELGWKQERNIKDYILNLKNTAYKS
ncbi:MAG: NAD-dependent epimerase/dehydratase family protein [Candidatus Nomurabacteria bacterium]|nr:NAD-dependent epimerase/dehydratase family protein [Candidatus Nomurabacteria bacterium]